MKSLKKIAIGVGIFMLICYVLLQIPLPTSKEQLEFDEAIYTAQRLALNGQSDVALTIFNALEDEYPSTAIYIELEKEVCYKKLKQFDKYYESCLNSKLTEYMPTRAAVCAKDLANVKKFKEALSIWDKNIQDKPEEIFAYTNINPYEQWRVKMNMKITNYFKSLFEKENFVEGIKKQSLEDIKQKQSKSIRKTKT